MNNHLAKAKKYVQDHKEAIKAVAITAAITVPVIALQQMGIKSLNTFIAEKGLFEEYYQGE